MAQQAKETTKAIVEDLAVDTARDEDDEDEAGEAEGDIEEDEDGISDGRFHNQRVFPQATKK